MIIEGDAMESSALIAGIHAPADYLQWGVVSISVPNAIVIAIMITLFVLAVVIPFPKDKAKS